MQIRIGIVDDHKLFSDTLGFVLNATGEFSIAFMAENGHALQTELANGSKADVLLLDLQMPEMDGFQTLKWLQKNHPELPVIILTACICEYTLVSLLQSGARGFLKKEVSIGDLKHGINTVFKSGYLFNEFLTSRMIHHITTGSKSGNFMLSDNEVSFLKLICSDKTYHEVAAELGITFRSVDKIRGDLFQKINVKSRVGLSLVAFNHGLR